MEVQFELDTIIYIASVLTAAGVIWKMIGKPLKEAIGNIATKDEFQKGFKEIHDKHGILQEKIDETLKLVENISVVQNDIIRERLTWLLREYIRKGYVYDDNLYDAVEKMYNTYVRERHLNGRVEKLWEEVQKLPMKQKGDVA